MIFDGFWPVTNDAKLSIIDVLVVPGYTSPPTRSIIMYKIVSPKISVLKL